MCSSDLDDTPGCTKESCAFQDNLPAFKKSKAAVLGVSVLNSASKKKFADKYGLKFPLLADTDKKVAELYGTVGPLGFPRRSVFVVNPDGVITYAHRAIAGLTFRPVEELVAAVAAAGK